MGSQGISSLQIQVCEQYVSIRESRCNRPGAFQIAHLDSFPKIL